MAGRKMKLFAGIATLVTLFSLLFSVAFAQEVSSPESSFSVKAYYDSNGNSSPDDGEELNEKVQYAFVPGVTCSSVEPGLQMSDVNTITTPFGVSVEQVACIFFMFSSRGGLVSITHYDAMRTTVPNVGPSPTLWMLKGCKCKVNLPLVARAWSGQR